ncbi:MAG: mechanosensitive ion channel family protein [Candidatus Gracilibacteria bacterium]|nr:mechanosensitive ion channel family protein [Candidatus Gracilibacteria bacterium]
MDFPLFIAQAATRTTTSQVAETSSEIVTSILSSVTILRNVLLSVGILFLFYIIGKLISRRIIKWLHEAKGESLYPDMTALINRFSVFGSLFVGFAIVVQFIFNFDFVQVVGFFGLGISFAFKDLLSNLIAGAVVIIQNRFRIGDFIQIGKDGLKGKVMEIQTRATILKAIDGTEIVIPNSQLMTKPVITFTAHKKRRIDIAMKVDFGTDIAQAREVALEVMKNKEHVLKKPAPLVLVSRIGDYAIELSMRFYIDPQNKEKSWILTKSELTEEIKNAYDAAGIKIPVPKRDIGR